MDKTELSQNKISYLLLEIIFVKGQCCCFFRQGTLVVIICEDPMLESDFDINSVLLIRRLCAHFIKFSPITGLTERDLKRRIREWKYTDYFGKPPVVRITDKTGLWNQTVPIQHSSLSRK